MPEDVKEVESSETEDKREGHVEPKEEDEKLPFHKHPRFREVTKERREFKEKSEQYAQFGAPTEVAEKLNRLAMLDTLIAQHEEQRETDEPKTQDQVELERVRLEYRKKLREIDPAIERGERASQVLDTWMSSLEEEATEQTVALMKEAGLGTDQKAVSQMSEVIADCIKSDPKLHRRYFRTPEAAVKQAWGMLLEQFGGLKERQSKAALQTTKEQLKKVPKPHGSGGGSESDKHSSPPKNLKEFEKRARERFANLE